MFADKNMVYDGQTYKKGEAIHDLGSFECVSVDGKQRNYEGLSYDAPMKLPQYDDLETGSSALCLDTGEYYKYHAPTKTWYML